MDIDGQLSLQRLGCRQADQSSVAEAIGVAEILAGHVVGRAVRHILHQAEDRIHRIGQTHEVYIYDIIMSDSIDTFIDDCLSRKVSMANEFKRRIKKHKKFDERRDKDGKSLLTRVSV